MDIRYSCNQKDFKRYTTEESWVMMKASVVITISATICATGRWA